MPFYNDLRPESDYEKKDYALVFPGMTSDEKIRTIGNLIKLKKGLGSAIPPRKADTNLLVASWNIKEFGHTTQRLNESYFYIAEIISKFDLVAIQEVKSTLKDLEIVMRILGSDWDYIINDITDGTDGNSERSAYLFNNKRVRLGGLAGEIVLWDSLTEGFDIKQLKRTPYITGFTAGWKKFALINIHLHPGDNSDDLEIREQEVELLLAALNEKVDKRRLWSSNLVLVGDFNLYDGANKDDPTIQLIHDAGYCEIENLLGKDTNASQTEAYDRFFIKKNDYFQVVDEGEGDIGDVFNPFEFVFKEDEHLIYEEKMKQQYTGSKDLDEGNNLIKYFLNPWRRNQISDHFPIWFELDTDSSEDFLKSKQIKLEN